MDDLLRYSAADLDPYTVTLGQQLCSKFTFSQLGYRNLNLAFDSLPGSHYSLNDFEIGYGAYHVLPVLLKSESGFALAAVIGALSEYFSEDIVVGFLMLLTTRSDVPVAQRPLEHQWRRLVDVFCGVLTTSTFGLVLSELEDRLPPLKGDVSTESLLRAVTAMSDAVRKKGQTIALSAGAGCIWLAAVASWLFDLKFVVHSTTSKVLYATPGMDPRTDARVIFSFPFQTSDISVAATAQTPTTPRRQMTGGRVSFEHFFQSCFGGTSAVLRDKALAGYVCSALTILTSSMRSNDSTLNSFFLSRDITHSSSGWSRLRDVLLAWFPELGRQTKQFMRYERLVKEDAGALFDESVSALTEQCTCATCPTSTTLEERPDRFCKVTLAELIVTLAVYISPMVVAPKMLPKRHGVLALYEDFHAARVERQTSTTSPSQTFITSIPSRIPDSVETLRTSALLFAGTTPRDLDGTTNVMGLTSTGLTVFLSGDGRVRGDRASDERWHVSVMVSPGWMCLFGHEVRLEVYDPGYAGWDFERIWAEVRDGDHELTQVVKWRGRVMVSSLLVKGSPEEKQAEADGWVLFA